jgi:signal peptidase I
MLKKIFLFLRELIKLAAIALVIIVPVRYFLIQPFYVKGTSMEPNFHNYEYLIIDELSYQFHTPQRGEVIVFRYPRDPQEHFIKRVIGLPGEDVQIKNNHVYIYNTQHPDGFILNETYLKPDEITVANNENRITLKDDEYFVLGDNRQASQDSRFFGAVNKSFITGRVWLRGLPISEAKVFTQDNLPKY